MDNTDTFLRIAKKASSIGSEILLDYFGKGISVVKKGPVDIVTKADKESEQAVIETILHEFPNHSIIAEETGNLKGNSEFKWIIDPLDGTTNFAGGLPVFSVSIALYKDDQPILGIVENPVTKQIFYGISQKGAYLNEEPINISGTSEIKDSLIVTGFPYNFMEILPELEKRFFNVLKNARGVRRLGSAALDLCYVACGIFEGFFEQNLKPWDTAAGIIIAREAGAVITDYRGNEFTPDMNEIAATNGLIHKSLISLMERK